MVRGGVLVCKLKRVLLQVSNGLMGGLMNYTTTSSSIFKMVNLVAHATKYDRFYAIFRDPIKRVLLLRLKRNTNGMCESGAWFFHI